MSPEPRTEARFPQVPAGAGHYESFYLKANDPAGGRAVWLRHTVHQVPGQPLTGSLWLTLFDAEAGKPKATKSTYAADQVSAPDGAYIKVGEATLGAGRAVGSCDGARWDLSFDPGAEPLRHLGRDFLYRSRLPRTKLLSPNPNSPVSGSVEIGGRTIEFERWPGMIGHNWGSEHAESWIWIQAANLDGRDGDYLDVALGRVRFAGRTTPWISNGRIVLGGESCRIGGLTNAYGTSIEETPTGCEFTLQGKDVNVKGRVGADASEFVGWVYADPSGRQHNVLNCSIADIELRVERPSHRHAKIAARGTAVYELGTGATDHGIPLQPYGDG